MRYYYQLSNGTTPQHLATLQRAGVPTGAIEKDLTTFHRLERGSVLHQRGCSALDGKPTVAEHHSILAVAGKSMHSPCTRWRTRWKNETVKALQTAVFVAEVVNETNDLKGRSEPAFSHLSLLLTEVRTDDAADAFQEVYGRSTEYDQVLKDLLLLEKGWAGSGSSERAAACVVQALSCPRGSIRLLGADHDKAWRLARAGWEEWQQHVAAEKPLADAHQAAATAIEQFAKRLRKNGETVRDEETAGVRALTRSWEKALKAAASAEEGEVLIAVKGGSMHPHSPLARAAAAFPSARSAAVAAVRVPTQVADWITDSTDAWQSKHMHILGVAAETDTRAVLETLVAVWDPAGIGDAADVRKALQAARTLAG